MNCINCGVSTSEFGVYRGGSIIYCTKCGVDFDFETGELLLRGSSIEAGSKRWEKFQDKKKNSIK